MSRDYPDRVDPWKAAEGRRTFSGSMPIERMPRLLPLLAPPVGEARFAARFAFDEERRVVIRIEVDAALPLTCQRSLGRYLEPVHRESVLGVMRSLDEESLLPGHYEPVLAEHGRVALQALVEDELLLGVPQVPRDPSVEPVQRSTDTGRESVPAPDAGTGSPGFRRPFADLADRLRQRPGEEQDPGQDHDSGQDGN